MTATVIVEFFGIARARAGRAELSVTATTPREAIRNLAIVCPALADVWTTSGKLVGHYLLSLDGERFLTDLDEPLPTGARLLFLSADAGG